MTQDSTTYYVWIGGSCDYGHKERAGGAAVVIEHNGNIISRDVISDLHTTEFRMMLTLMVKVMQEIPEGSDILFLTNAAYIQNFDKAPTSKSANPDLIIQCIKEKKKHNSVGPKKNFISAEKPRKLPICGPKFGFCSRFPAIFLHFHRSNRQKMKTQKGRIPATESTLLFVLL